MAQSTSGLDQGNHKGNGETADQSGPEPNATLPLPSSPEDRGSGDAGLSVYNARQHILKLERLALKTVEDLGLDEKHEYLYNNLALYKRFTLAIIPPLQASLQMLNFPLPEEEDPNASDKEELEARIESEEKHELGDDHDVVIPLGEYHGLNSFLSMLATALAGAGAAGLRSFGKILYDRNKPADDAGPPPGRDTDFPEPTVGQGSIPRPDIPSTISSHTLATILALLRFSSSIQRAFTNDLQTRASDDSSSIAQLRRARPPPANLRTDWENSVMEKYNLGTAGDRVIVHYKENDTNFNTETADKREILTYHIARTLKESFDFEDDNVLYNHFDVWLLKDVLLQGHMYITRDAVCFYSLLPGEFSEAELNDPNMTLHSGALGIKFASIGDSYFSSVVTHRFWAVLKPSTLSIYKSPTKQHFPVKTIDLKTAIACEILTPSPTASTGVSSPKDTTRSPIVTDINGLSGISEDSSISEDEDPEEITLGGVWFKVICNDKTYRFHTSSIYSARHWYNTITKAIFQLNNTNSRKEAILKLPIEDILDFRKIFILADSDEQDADNKRDDDAPMSFAIKFNLSQTEFDSTIEKLKLKTKGQNSFRHPHDFSRFIAFHRGQELSQTLEKVLEDNVIRSVSFNQRVRSRAKRLFKEDRYDSSPAAKRRTAIVTTIQPEFSSGTSLIDKIAEHNAKLMEMRQKELYKFRNGMVVEPSNKDPSEKPKSKNKKERFIPRLSPSHSTTSMTELLDSMDLEDDAKVNRDFVELDGNLNFPKPFSLRNLKELDVQFVRTRRSFAEIIAQFGSHLEIVDLKRQRANLLISDISNSTNEKADDLNESSRENSTSSSLQTSESSSKRKLTAIKKGVQTVTSLGGLWTAKPEHYDPHMNSDHYFVNNVPDRIKAINNFRNSFSLGPECGLVAIYYVHLKRNFPVYGKLYLGKDQLCFKSKIPGVSTKMILPLKDIQKCEKNKWHMRYYGISIKVRGGRELQIDFGRHKSRDDCRVMIMKQLKREGVRTIDGAVLSNEQSRCSSLAESLDEQIDEDLRSIKIDELAAAKVRLARLTLLEDKVSLAAGIEIPLILEDNPFTATEVQLTKSFHIVFLTIGSRGDVQPYIALGLGLLKEGHRVTIATHSEFREWIEKHGIQFREIAGNPAELMLLMVTHGSISVAFLKEASSKFRGWINELLLTSWEACKDAEILIESPSTMAGNHIAEALNIPYMRAFTMPWTRTRAYPHAFIVPDQKRGGSYNYLTHVMFENVFWKGISGQVNKWRVETLGLGKTNLVKMQQSRVPFLYNVSPAMFPPSVDFPDWVKVTGYWFLDEGKGDFEPPADLLEFFEEARKNEEKVIYVGFGSIVVSDAKMLTKTIVDAVMESGVRCILNKGWSDRLSESKSEIEVELPPQIYKAGTIPHDWLFPRVDAAVHHGGSGTTGATLRAGIPTIVKPFFGDQFFFSSRVEDLGVGIGLKNINKKSLMKALKAVINEKKYAVNAKAIAREISGERGVSSAIELIYSELAYSKSLIQIIRHNNEDRKPHEDKSGIQTPLIDEETLEMLKKYDGDLDEEFLNNNAKESMDNSSVD